MPCAGVAAALGVEPEIVQVAPRLWYAPFAPWGPADPADPGLRAPFPDIAIASGKETVPYLRALKKRSDGATFTLFLGDPRVSCGIFDLIWTPAHDRLTGANVFKTLTAPHPHDATALASARARADGRLAGLASPRVAVMLGGPSGQYRFGDADSENVRAAVARLLAEDARVMISPSRRTPDELVERLKHAIADAGATDRAFVWDGSGDNPYQGMLALADAFLVTCDSVNMIGEALATGKPVHVLKLEGEAGKFGTFFERLQAGGYIRFWKGALEDWSYAPLDATAEIAGEVARRYALFVQARAGA